MCWPTMATKLVLIFYLLYLLGAFTFATLKSAKPYKHLGCFRDSSPNRTLPAFLSNSLPKCIAIQTCAALASTRGYTVFAVQYKTECWASYTNKSYSRYGRATNCVDGKGGGFANDVYQFTVVPWSPCPGGKDVLSTFGQNTSPLTPTTVTTVKSHKGNYNITTIASTVIVTEQESVPIGSTSTTPTIYTVVIITLALFLGVSLIINGYLVNKLQKTKKSLQTTSSMTNQPTTPDTAYERVSDGFFIQGQAATNDEEINQSTQETREYVEVIDNTTPSRHPMAMSNATACSPYMPLKPKEFRSIYQPLLRNAKEMENERKEGKEPAEYLEMLPEEPSVEKDLTTEYEDMSLKC